MQVMEILAFPLKQKVYYNELELYILFYSGIELYFKQGVEFMKFVSPQADCPGK